MEICEMKAKSITACPGGVICAAEALVVTDDRKRVYVTYAEDDLGEHYTVSDVSMYTYLIDHVEEVPVLTEEYEKQKEAKASAYGKVFALLKKTLKNMDEVA